MERQNIDILILAVRTEKKGRPFLKILDSGCTPFERGDMMQERANKGILSTRLQTPEGANFALLGTHTQTLDTRAGLRGSHREVQGARRVFTQPLPGLQLWGVASRLSDHYGLKARVVLVSP